MAGGGSSMRLLALTALLAGQAWSLRTYGKDDASATPHGGPWKPKPNPWMAMQRVPSNVVEKHHIVERPKVEQLEFESPSTDSSVVAFVEAHPNYTGLAPQGTLQVRNHNHDGLAIQGVVTGLNLLSEGMFYIYEGYSCEDIRNVMTGMEGPWSADEHGMASIFQKLSVGSLQGAQSVLGRTLVFFDDHGDKICCGMLELTSGQVSHISQFPGHTGVEAVQGTLITTETSDGIRITGTLGGLPRLTSAGVRVHSGYSCSTGPAVGRPYTEGLPKDVISTSAYTSDEWGSAQVSLLVGGFSLYYDSPVMGRVIVVQGKAAKIGCGVIGSAKTLVASFGAFPGYAGAAPSGTVAVTASKGGVQVEGVLTGLPPSLPTVVTLHSGVDCMYAMSAGEAYRNELSSNLGTASFTSDNGGAGKINQKWAGFSISDFSPVAGRVLLISDEEGVNMGCATLKVTNGAVTQLGQYPGHNGTSRVKGTLITTELRSGIQLEGTVAGLPLSSVGSYQIHEGFSCEGAAGVGAPYAGGSAGQPASNLLMAGMTTTYMSDASGSAQISETVSGMSLYDNAPVMGRTIVFHQSEDHFACGLVGRAEDLVASMGASPNSENLALSGTVHAIDVTGGIRIRAVLTGMNIHTSGSFRIHSGFSCSSGDLGDAYANLTDFESDKDGSAAVDMDLQGFTLVGPQPVAGRAVVLYSGKEEKPVGCGLLQVTPGHVTHIGAYPGSQSEQKVSGVIVTEETDTGVTMRGTLAGLPPSTTAGFHFASGYSCLDEKAIGGEYYGGLVGHPWAATYASNDHGAAQIFQTVQDFSLFSELPVLARALVLEGPAAAKLGCGASAPAALRREAAARAPAPPAAEAAAPAAAGKAAKRQKLASGSDSSGSPSPLVTGVGIGVFATSLAYTIFMTYVWASQHPDWAERTLLDPDEWSGVDGGVHHGSHHGISSGLV